MEGFKIIEFGALSVVIPWNKQYLPKFRWVRFVKLEFSLMRVIFISN